MEYMDGALEFRIPPERHLYGSSYGHEIRILVDRASGRVWVRGAREVEAEYVVPVGPQMDDAISVLVSHSAGDPYLVSAHLIRRGGPWWRNRWKDRPFGPVLQAIVEREPLAEEGANFPPGVHVFAGVAAEGGMTPARIGFMPLAAQEAVSQA